MDTNDKNYLLNLYKIIPLWYEDVQCSVACPKNNSSILRGLSSGIVLDEFAQLVIKSNITN